MKTILVTGGAGFIGSHLLRKFVQHPGEQYLVVNLDKLTYAGNPANLADLSSSSNLIFRKGCITNQELLRALFGEFDFQAVIHLAAESHVDRSIEGPLDFVQTNVVGTATLLQVAREFWKDPTGKLFYHVSTDEVYGSLGETGKFCETTPYDPHSPYSASKAASDHLVRAFGTTYRLPILISNCSNNYGPNQFPEKLIPTVISRLLEGATIPVYGSGQNVRDWLFVEDHVEAIDCIFHRGRPGSTYNVGGDCEVRNLVLVEQLCDIFDTLQSRPAGTARQQIRFVTDRAGHDFRYAIDCSKLKSELGWSPKTSLEDGLRRTVAWYLANHRWLADIHSGAYMKELL